MSSTNPLGFASTNVFDAANRLVATVDPLGNTSSLGYDAASRLMSQTDPLREHIYDSIRCGLARDRDRRPAREPHELGL